MNDKVLMEEVAAIEKAMVNMTPFEREFLAGVKQCLDAFEARLGRHIDGMWKPSDDVPPVVLDEMKAAFKDIERDN